MKSPGIRRLFTVLAILALLIVGVRFSHAAAFSSVVSFGDSLSDNGNLFALTFGAIPDKSKFYHGRFSNGPLWMEYLAQNLGQEVTLSSYAIAGSYTKDASLHGLTSQVASFLAEKTVQADTLHTLWSGGNDLFDGFNSPYQAARNVCGALDSLLAAGAAHVLVLNLPNLGSTPRIRHGGEYDRYLALTIQFNQELKAGVDALAREYPGTDLYLFDVFALFNQIINNPLFFGFGNVEDVSPQLGAGFDNSEGYLFWDEIHPTTEFHALLARYVRDLIGAGHPRYTGWWYTPGAEGSGIAIEVQNDTCLLCWYSYDGNGAPFWLTALGENNGSGYSGDLYRWEGWPLGGAYRAPQTERMGSVSISFHDSRTALFSWTLDDLSGSATLEKLGAEGSDTIAGYIQDGWWSFPDYPGMGLFLDINQDELFIGWDHYNEQGQARWWVTSGPATDPDSSFSSVFVQYQDGQIIGREYRLPAWREQGGVDIRFHSPNNATLWWGGASYEITRFNFGETVQ